MSVLVVEDEIAIRGLLCREIEAQGVTVHGAADLEAARESLRHHEFDVVILDLGLPDGSGMELLNELRESGSTTHVIMLSGGASEAGRVESFDRGADDFVVKPFSVRELTARVLGARRRRNAVGDSRLHVGNLDIDVASRRVVSEGRELELTAMEFDLLAFLAARAGHVFNRDELLRSVWGSASAWQQSATVTEHVRRLRAKIETDPHHPVMLRTVRGIGYRFDIPACGSETGHDDSSSALAATIVAVDGSIAFADQAAGELFGSAASELVGSSVLDLVAPRSLDIARERSEASESGQPFRSQLMYLRRSDGTEVQAEVSSVPTKWNQCRARRLVITETIDESERLRRFATGVVTELSDAVIVTDPRFHIQCWNHAAERLYGWSEQEARGRHLRDIVPEPELAGSIEGALKEVQVNGRWFGNARQITRDGSIVTVQASTTLVRDDDGAVIGIASVNRLVAASTDRSATAETVDETAIRRGLDNDEFDVWYQPCVALDDLHVIAVEALVRWNHPERGVLMPADFIAVAERSGLILELGAFVLNKACRQVAAWQLAGVGVDLAVNVSARELADPALGVRIAASLESAGLSASVLWLEVTETALVEDFEQVSAALHGIARTGVRISIDDFGTGWASLTYLQRLPVHALKIDRVFVEGLVGSANDTAIVRSILTLGVELGLSVTAEGIETPAQERALKRLGCSLGQGFLYGKPTPAADVPVRHARRNGGVARLRQLEETVWPPPVWDGRRPEMVATESEGIDGPVTDMLRALLRIRSAPKAAEILQSTARRLGATLVCATDATADALPIDLSLGEGPALLATATPMSVARMQLERLLPRLVEDARRAIDLLRRTEAPGRQS